jgi:hypothetical protein
MRLLSTKTIGLTVACPVRGSTMSMAHVTPRERRVDAVTSCEHRRQCHCLFPSSNYALITLAYQDATGCKTTF